MAANHTNTAPFNDTKYFDGSHVPDSVIKYVIAAAVTIGICLIGIAGNTIVLWFLFFRIQRNKHTVYIMNLAVADLMLLTVTAVLMMVNINTLVGSNPDFQGNAEFLTILEIIYDLSLYSGMYLLTVLSVERCISVRFPLWYRSYCPKTLSVVMCVCLWIFGCTESLIENLACPSEDFSIQTPVCTGVEIMTFTLSNCICLPLMILSTFTLIITIKRTFRDRYPPRLYIIIIAAIFSYILSVIPFNFIWFLMYFRLLLSIQDPLKIHFASILNTAFNPYIYLLVGRLWKQKSNHSIHDTLHRAFKVEEDEKEDIKYEKENTSSNSGETNSTCSDSDQTENSNDTNPENIL